MPYWQQEMVNSEQANFSCRRLLIAQFRQALTTIVCRKWRDKVSASMILYLLCTYLKFDFSNNDIPTEESETLSYCSLCNFVEQEMNCT